MTKQSQISLATKLQRIATRSHANPVCTFGWLMPLFNTINLECCFHELDRKKAVGIDGVSKDEYGKKLHDNLEAIIVQMKRNGYRPQPMRLVEIPKSDGSKRPISIACTEDKIVETLFAKILTAIYEPVFDDCSYGFRPGRTPHQAVRRLHGALFKSRNAHVIDIDLADYFGSIEHEKLLSVLAMRIKDEAFLRQLSRFLKNGHSTKGETKRLRCGVPQGSILGPILSNIYAHYCIDKWCAKRKNESRVEVIRFADDLVAVAPSKYSAESFLVALKARLSRCGLRLNESKSCVVSFSVLAQRSGKRQGSFSFLGFQFYLSKSRKGNLIPMLQTDPKRFRQKLRSLKEWCSKAFYRRKLTEVWPLIQLKIQGHINYFGVSFNQKRLAMFVWRCKQSIFKMVNRRSQRKSYTWEQFEMFIKQFGLPQVKIKHLLW